MKNLSKLHIPVALLILAIMFCSCSTTNKGLTPGRYTYKQIKAAGYACAPFKGRHYIRPTADSSRADIFSVK